MDVVDPFDELVADVRPVAYFTMAVGPSLPPSGVIQVEGHLYDYWTEQAPEGRYAICLPHQAAGG